MRILFLCLALFQPHSSQDRSEATPPGADTATLRLRLTDRVDRAPIAYEVVRNNILFRVTINGHPATVLLDNGADRTLIDRSFAQRVGIGLRPSNRRVVTSALTEVATATTDAVTIEAARSFRAEGAMVALDLRPVERALGKPIDAVLGSDVLDHFALLIDPRARQLSFHQGGSAKPMTGTTSLQIGPGSTVAAELNEQKVGLRIDLGYSGVIRLSKSAWQRVIPAGAPTRDGSQTSADGTTRATQIGEAALRIGSVRIDRVPVDSGYVPAGTADGLLGNGFLSRGPFILDQKGRQLLLLPRQQRPDGPRTP